MRCPTFLLFLRLGAMVASLSCLSVIKGVVFCSGLRFGDP
jgi:hypothetical protein